MAEFIRTGALQMAIVPCSVPEGYDADFAIVGAPYLYDNIDHLEKATLNGVFDTTNARTIIWHQFCFLLFFKLLKVLLDTELDVS